MVEKRTPDELQSSREQKQKLQNLPELDGEVESVPNQP